MKQLTRLFLLLLSVNVLADCLPVTVRNPAGNYIVPGSKGDIVYARVNGQELALDAYVQKRGDKRPAVIVIHGGGFTSGSRVSFIGQFLEMLTSAGYNWFAVDYRKKGVSHYKDSLADVRAALAFVRCNAKAFRTDPNRIALLGEDTGATLAALLAAEKPAGVQAKVLIGGVYDWRKMAPVMSESPETLVIHGTADQEAVPAQATRYCEALRHSCASILVEGAIHRPENWRPEQWNYKPRLLQWLNEKLKLKAADHEPYKTNLQKDIPYRMVGRQEWLGLDAYVPSGRGPFPAVIIAHGGGWEAGDKVTYATPLFEPLAKAGFAWFSINYRLTPEAQHQDQLDDVREAIRYVKAYAKSFQIDPNRIALLGESASGQMVSYLATNGQIERAQGTHVAAVVSFYGVYDLAAMVKNNSPRALHARLFGLSELNDQAWRLLRRYSPLHNLDLPRAVPNHSSARPPLLLICGTKDGLYSQQEAFAQKLKHLNESHETLALEGAPHGMENWEGHPEWMNYKQQLVEWLRVQLRR